jgi:hypothetical protein
VSGEGQMTSTIASAGDIGEWGPAAVVRIEGFDDEIRGLQ